MTKPTTTEVEVTQETRDLLFPVLREHWLTDLGCSHDGEGSNRVACYCGWAGNRVANVGQAVDQWAAHLSSVAGFEVDLARHRTRTSPEAGELVERLRAERREIRDRIPMDYLERHGNDLAAAMKDYAEDRWKLLGRLKRLEEAGDRMAEALRQADSELQMWRHANATGDFFDPELDGASGPPVSVLKAAAEQGKKDFVPPPPQSRNAREAIATALTDWRAVREGG